MSKDVVERSMYEVRVDESEDFMMSIYRRSLGEHFEIYIKHLPTKETLVECWLTNHLTDAKVYFEGFVDGYKRGWLNERL